MAREPAPIPARLVGRWQLVVVAVALGTVAIAVALADAFGRTIAFEWLVISALPIGYLLVTVRRLLGYNLPPAQDDPKPTTADGGDPVHPTLGVANGLTISRGWLYACVAGFVQFVPPTGSPWRWLPAILYGTGALLDWGDGFIAKRLGRPTQLGSRLDMAFDTMGFLVAPLVAVAWGALPAWYLSISAARYLFRLGQAGRRLRGLALAPLSPNRLRRPLAALQMVVIAVALAPSTSAQVMWPLATVAMVPSLVVFGWDYLVVSNRVGGPNANDASRP